MKHVLVGAGGQEAGVGPETDQRLKRMRPEEAGRAGQAGRERTAPSPAGLCSAQSSLEPCSCDAQAPRGTFLCSSSMSMLWRRVTAVVRRIPVHLRRAPGVLWSQRSRRATAATAVSHQAAMQPGSASPLACLVVPPATATRDITALESTIQALALPGCACKRAVALELVGTPVMRGFIVRGATAEALHNAVTQLQAQYPQAEMRPLPLSQDPLRLEPGETVSACELRFAGDAFLSLRTWTPGLAAHSREGADPLVGLLAALGQVPNGLRAVAHLALVPASDTWSHGYEHQADRRSLQRLRLDDGLRERERLQAELLRDSAGFPLPLVVLVLLGSLGWLVWRQARPGEAGRYPWIPQPVSQTLARALHGQVEAGELVLLALAAGTFLVLGAFAIRRLRSLPAFAWLRQRYRVYDPDRIAAKTQQPAYRARLRLFVIGPAGQTPAERREGQALRAQVLERMTAAYRQFHLAGGAHFASTALSTRTVSRLLPLAPSAATTARRAPWVRGLAGSADLFSLSEVATLWHLPQACDVADLAWLRDEERARTILAPPVLVIHPDRQRLEESKLVAPGERPPAEHAETGSTPIARPAGLTAPVPRVLGSSRHAGQEVRVQAPPDLFMRHTLAVAKTGKGKSTLLLHLARLALMGTPPPGGPVPAEPQQINAEAPGLLLLDPHGDLAPAFLGLVPPSRREDVVIVDLADTAYPVALNPLDVTLGCERDKAVENLLLIFSHIWSRFWGPRMENALEFALKTLYEANRYLVEQDPQLGPDVQFTLLDVAPILSIPSFRHRLLSHVRDPHLLAWWAQYYEPLDLRMQLEIINPVLTKLAKFSSSQVARRIVGQGRSTLNLARLVTDGQVVLVNTARGHVGADTAALVGATLLGLLRMTLEEQARRVASARRRAVILVDEFQTMPGADYGAMLAELRKFGAGFVLATQALAQLDTIDRTLRPTVLANVDNLFAFTVSAEDAHVLVRELDDVVTERDLINLPPLTAYAKLTLHGRRLPVFSLGIDPPLPGDAALHRALVQASRARVARPVAAVDALLAELAARHTPPRTLDTWVHTAAHDATRGYAATSGLAGSTGSAAVEAGGIEQAEAAGIEPRGTVHGRRRAGRRHIAVDPLALAGIAPRQRPSRIAPFAFAPLVASDMDVDLRPLAASHRAGSPHGIVLPSPVTPSRSSDEEGLLGDAGSTADDDRLDSPRTDAADRQKKRRRGSRGGGGKARAVSAPAEECVAGDVTTRSTGTIGGFDQPGETTGAPAAGLRESGWNGVVEGGDEHE